MSDDDTVRLEFTQEQAEALLTYTKTSIQGDDSFDEFREKVSDARDVLEQSLSEKSKPDRRENGLYAKYKVTKGGKPVENCFVLEPEVDSAAREALIRYAEETDNEELAADLREWVVTTTTRGESK